MAQPQQNRAAVNIEFIVKPKDDLFLEGSLRRLPRVSKGDAYPCQMQKQQTFACLFRHYAKHNGLRKEDLVFTFTDELLPDQTPETVHLMPQDEIWVEHRTKQVEEVPPPVTPIVDTFTEQFRTLLESGAHADVTFKVGPQQEELRAHRAILSARSQYFHNMLSNGMYAESQNGVIRLPAQEVAVVKLMLEFLYTNGIRNLEAVEPDVAIELLAAANLYLLNDLRILCEQTVKNYITIDNVARLFGYSQNHNASVLRAACCDFTRDNNETLYSSAKFQADLISNPELAVLVMESNLPRGKRPSLVEGGVAGGYSSSSSTSAAAAVAGPGGAIIGGGLSGNEDSQDNNNANGGAGDHGAWFGAPQTSLLTSTTTAQVNATMAQMMQNTLAHHEAQMHTLALQHFSHGNNNNNSNSNNSSALSSRPHTVTATTSGGSHTSNAPGASSAAPSTLGGIAGSLLPAPRGGGGGRGGSATKRRRIGEANSETEPDGTLGEDSGSSSNSSNNNSGSSSPADASPTTNNHSAL